MATVCVSVIVPTRNRPSRVVNALASALNQDFESFEVIVVIDGDGGQTEAALRCIADARLRVIDLAVKMGGAEARNIGVREARGEWVAFLDDDAEWLPHKLSRQIVAARSARSMRLVISSRLIVRTPTYELVEPVRNYSQSRPVSEFLFCRQSLSDGPFAMQTSTLMVPRELALAVPFRRELRRYQEWDWLLRAERVPGVTFAVINEPLVIYHAEDARENIGRSQDAALSMAWAKQMRGFFSAKAYSWFLATECASRAAKSRAGWRVYAEIARRYIFEGMPSPGSAIRLAAFLGLPPGWRRWAHRFLRRWRRSGAAQGAVRKDPVVVTIGMES
jgi:hypothetical protein